MIKASGRAALIVLAGVFLLSAGAAQAASGAATGSRPDGASNQAEAVKPGKQRRHASHRQTAGKTAQKSSDDTAGRNDAAAKTDEARAANDVPASSQMPPQVANANAQLVAADTPTAAAASAMTNRANDNVQAAADNTAAPHPETQAVAPDQPNDADRVLQQDNPAEQKAAIAASDAQPRPGPVLAASGQQSSAWDQSSLIGKIFIGFGALLTLASAARMFMA
jgi:hypothetical protein